MNDEARRRDEAPRAGLEFAPLTSREERSLRAIAQELTRTDPSLVDGREHGPSGRPLRAGPVGLAVASWCAVIAVSAVTFGALSALVVGVVLALATIIIVSSGAGRPTAEG